MQAILWLPFPVFVLVILLIVAVCIGAALGLLWFIRRLDGNLTERLPQATFVAVTATAWALSLGFAASDIFALNSKADQSVLEERSSISRIMGTAAPDALDLPEMYETIVLYGEAVVEEEWGARHNRSAAPEVETLLQSLRVQIIQMHDRGIPDVVVGKTIRDFDELQDARNKRLAVGQSVVDDTKWYLVIGLSILTSMNIALVNAVSPKAAYNALAVYAMAVFMCLTILGINSDPYRTMYASIISPGTIAPPTGEQSVTDSEAVEPEPVEIGV